MLCISCKTEILAVYKHAFAKNECPSCGGQILDEETLAIIDDVEKTISAEVVLREGTAKKLAISLVAKYNIGVGQIIVKEVFKETKQENIKIAQPSIISQIEIDEKEPSVIKRGEMTSIISQIEREQMLAEAASQRYGLTEGIESSTDTRKEEFMVPNGNSNIGGLNLFPEDNASILEQERIYRLKHQQNVLAGGTSANGKPSFRRSG